MKFIHVIVKYTGRGVTAIAFTTLYCARLQLARRPRPALTV